MTALGLVTRAPKSIQKFYDVKKCSNKLRTAARKWSIGRLWLKAIFPKSVMIYEMIHFTIEISLLIFRKITSISHIVKGWKVHVIYSETFLKQNLNSKQFNHFFYAKLKNLSAKYWLEKKYMYMIYILFKKKLIYENWMDSFFNYLVRNLVKGCIFNLFFHLLRSCCFEKHLFLKKNAALRI